MTLASTLLALAVGAAARETPRESEQREAAALYADAIRHYNLADYDEAIEGFKAVYHLTEAPELLFDIAQAYRLKGPGNCGDALRLYRNFVRLAPQSPKRKSAEAAIADMEKCAARSEAAPTTVEPPVAAPAPTPAVAAPAPPPEVVEPSAPMRRSKIAAAILAACGVALGAGSGGMWWSTAQDYGSLTAAACAPYCEPDRVNPVRLKQGVADALLIGALASLAAAIVLWLAF